MDAAGRTPTGSVAGDIGGLTFTTGVYNSTSTLALTGTVTLDAQGDPNAVFIFQIASALTTASASSVSLVNGARKLQTLLGKSGSSATLGTGSTFRGTIMALTSITVTTGTTVDGRALAPTVPSPRTLTPFTMSQCATPPGTPGQPTTTAGNGSATVTVTPPTSGGTPTSYTVTSSGRTNGHSYGGKRFRRHYWPHQRDVLHIHRHGDQREWHLTVVSSFKRGDSISPTPTPARPRAASAPFHRAHSLKPERTQVFWAAQRLQPCCSVP